MKLKKNLKDKMRTYSTRAVSDKPATHYSSLFPNSDKTTFLWKKVSVAKSDEKGSTHYSS